MVIVDDLRNSVDELDDNLGVVVAWCRLATNHDDSGNELLAALPGWRIFNGEVTMDNVEDV